MRTRSVFYFLLYFSGLTSLYAAEPHVATFQNGVQLLQACGGDSDIGKAYCLGFIAGVTSTLADAHLSKQPVCIPAGVTANQLSMVVQKFLSENPAKLHFSGAALTGVALVQAFPCR